MEKKHKNARVQWSQWVTVTILDFSKDRHQKSAVAVPVPVSPLLDTTHSRRGGNHKSRAHKRKCAISLFSFVLSLSMVPNHALKPERAPAHKRGFSNFLPQNNVGQRGYNPTREISAKAFANFSKATVDCGVSLSHQPDCCFPRLHFTSEIPNSAEKNGKDCPGIILLRTTLALLSKKGGGILNDLALMDNQKTISL